MIIIINGACGVGKTTISEQLALHFEDSVHIRGDDIHNFITESKIVPEQIAITDENIKDLVKNFKSYGFKTIIIDNVYETKEHLNKVTKELKQYDEKTISIRIHCNFEDNIYRDKLRMDEDIMGEQRIRELYDIFASQGDGVGSVFNTSGLSIQESVERLLFLIERKG